MVNRRDFLHSTALAMSCSVLAKNAGAGVSDGSIFRTVNSAGTVPRRDIETRFPFFKSVPVSYLHVKMQDRFWAPRQRITRDVSVEWATGHWDKAGGLKALRKDPTQYTAQIHPGDMEAIKFIEAMASVVGVQRDSAIERLIDSWGKRLIDAQGADGYPTFCYPIAADPAARWQATWFSHEDYVLGHYIESAIAYREATGSDALNNSAVRAADSMAATFLGKNLPYAPGHAEIEQALMRLYGVTGDKKYLQLCGWLIRQRGNHTGRKSFGKYAQDHLPVSAQRTIEGHAVRAAFLFNGVTEYVGATGDKQYQEAVLAIWDDLIQNKMYIHGASGNVSAKNEGYSIKQPSLRPDDTYGESCSVFANFQWAHSLFRLTGEAHYLDAAERILYNAFYASLSLHGDRFFYRNVAQAPEPLLRAEWHQIPCCPPNIVKLFSKVGGFFYSIDKQGIFVKHYGASEAQIPWGSGVKLIQRTEFPWDGRIRLQLEPAKPMKFALRLRVPDWAGPYQVSINGTATDVPLQGGWLKIEREWKSADMIELFLPMNIEQVTMPARFPEYAGLVALKRGPIIYCLEEQDVAFAPYAYRYVPKDATFTAEHMPDLLGGVTVLRGNIRLMNLMDRSETPSSATLIPYGVWNNRKPGWMNIWLPSRAMTMNDYLQLEPPSGDPTVS